METDRKRIAAVRTLEALGYTYCNGEWLAPPAVAGTPPLMTSEAEGTHGELMQRLDALPGCTEGASEEADLRAIVDLIEACEAMWGSLGEKPGGKVDVQGNALKSGGSLDGGLGRRGHRRR